MYLRNVIASAVFNLARPTQNSRRLTQLARQYLPYGLFKRRDGRFLVLNRQYKPIGFPVQKNHHFDYESDELILLTFAADDVAAQATPGDLVMLYTVSPWRDLRSSEEYKRAICDKLGICEFGEAGEA